jgi:predicted ATPase/DNA-binding CsgD family transcriptional regulator
MERGVRGVPTPAGMPVQLSSFIGRSHELAELATLFNRGRLITITGPGGSGKTRLALRFVEERAGDAAGRGFVDLAPLTDASMVPATIATSLAIREQAGERLLDTLAGGLGDAEIVLVLDNLEQIPDVGIVIAELLGRTSGLRIVATSRAPLHLRGELEYPLAPLALPSSEDVGAVDRLSKVEAVRLFVDRAQAIEPRFRLSTDNAEAVAAICARLDGLPLAIELAAARTRLLSPASLLERLDQRLSLLTDAPADAPARQQTLTATIAWSYDLLNAEDRHVLASLGVFVGGISLPAAEAVLGEADRPQPARELLEILGHLVEQSVLLVSRVDETARFRMLETIREYAWAQVAPADQDRLRDRHLAYYVGLAEAAEAELRGPDQAMWLRRLVVEQADVRAALAWAEAAGRNESLARLATALKRRFWYEAGGAGEAMRWLDAAMRIQGEAPPGLSARMLQRAGWLAMELGDEDRSHELFAASVAAAGRQGDEASAYEGLIGLGYAAYAEGPTGLDAAEERLDAALAHARHSPTPGATVEPLTALGLVARSRGDAGLARARYEEAIGAARAAGDAWGTGTALLRLGELELVEGDSVRAAGRLEEGIGFARESGDKELIGWTSLALARALVAHDDLESARSYLGAAAEVLPELRIDEGHTEVLEVAARWLAAASAYRAAIEAWATAEGGRGSRHWQADPADQLTHRRSLERTRKAMRPDEAMAAWTAGEARDPDDALAAAMAAVHGVDLAAIPATRLPARRDRFDLTPRERDVLVLVAAGMSDGEIADALVISKKTASVHVANIKGKLGASSRVEIATIALRLGPDGW